MSGIYHKNKVWANVTIPNPQDTATADLEKVKIDGTTYAVGGADTLSDLTDTAITSPSDEDVLQYDGSASKWINVTWTAFKAKLKTYFDTIYAKISSLAAHATVPLDNTTLKIGSDGSDSAVYSTCTKSTYYPSTSTLLLATKTDFNLTQLQEVFVPQVDIAEKSDTDPYIYRASVANGDRVSEDIVGASVGWNQLVQSSDLNEVSQVYGITRTKTTDGKGIRVYGTCSTSNNFTVVKSTINYIVGHKYFITFGSVSLPSGCKITDSYNVGTSDKQKEMVVNSTAVSSAVNIYVRNGIQIDVTLYPQVTDLTLVFGTTIADHIYSLEQATAGAGVAFFRKYFSKSYYPYNAGELLSVEVEGKKYVGKNLIDESQLANASGWTVSNGVYSGTIANMYVYANGGLPKQPKYFEKTVYTFRFKVVAASGNSRFRITYTDGTYSDAVITSSSAGSYVTTITEGGRTVSNISFTYNSGGNISISEMQLELGNTPTTYEPYHLTTYTFPSQTLRGLFTLVNDELKASGDVYGDDGVVTRKYGVVDLGTLTWNVSNTNGFYAPLPESKTGLSNLVCSKYPYDNTVNFAWANFDTYADKTIYKNTSSTSYLYVKDTSYSNKTTFTNAMSGVYLVYELAAPTTEQAEPLVMPQICDKNGTEEFVTTSIVPVGHESTYYNYPDYMEEGEYKDFRDRVDYAPEKAKWHKVGIYANGDTINIDGYYNEIMLVPNHYSGTTLLACASPAIFPFSLFKSITLQNSTESERIDITPAGVVGVTGTYFSNVSIYVR